MFCTQPFNHIDIIVENDQVLLQPCNTWHIKKKFSINLEKIIYELNGTICSPIDVRAPLKKQIISSRSFGHPIRKYNLLVEAITTFASIAAFKSRKQSTLAEYVTVFISSSPFKEKSHFYQNNVRLKLPYPTSDLKLILSMALQGIKIIYKADIEYAKCGVMLSGLIDSSQVQEHLWPTKNIKQSQLTQVIDDINFKFDKHSLRVATQPINPLWGMRQSKKSQSFTTSWDELLLVN